MLKLKLQYFGHLMWRTDSLEKTLMLGKIEGGRRRGERGWDDWMASPTQWTWVWSSSGRWWRTGKPGMLQSMGSQRVGHDWAMEHLQFVKDIAQWQDVSKPLGIIVDFFPTQLESTLGVAAKIAQILKCLTTFSVKNQEIDILTHLCGWSSLEYINKFCGPHLKVR